MALGYLVAALIMFVLIITIPFGVQALKLASFSLWPFGRTLVRKPTAGVGSVLGNLIWLVFAGWWIAVGHVATALVLAVTIIGIPFAVAHIKLAITALWPFGSEIVPISSLQPGQEAIVVDRRGPDAATSPG